MYRSIRRYCSIEDAIIEATIVDAIVHAIVDAIRKVGVLVVSRFDPNGAGVGFNSDTS